MKASFKPVQILQVYRRLSDGRQVLVGRLAQDQQGTYFQYDEAYLSHYHSLSPFSHIYIKHVDLKFRYYLYQ